MKKLIFFLPILFWAQINAQDGKSIYAKLSGDTQTEWTVKPFAGSLTDALEGKCTEGLFYTFHSDTTVTVKDCIAGSFQESTMDFSIEEEGKSIQIGDNSYGFDLQKKEAVWTLFLRPEDGQTLPMTYIEPVENTAVE